MSFAGALLLWSIAFVLSLWNLWLERRVRALTSEKDALCAVLVGISNGTHAVEIDGNKVKIKVIK
jgi:hypothetical protein